MNVGIIGSGAISGIYLKNLTQNHPNIRVLAVASKHPENARKKAAQFGLPSCTVEELLANPEIEMIVNLTPVGAHYEIIRRCLEAGKHVYTEKTITDHYESARELLTLAEEKGLYLGSAPDTFLGSAIQEVKAAVDSGMLGRIHSFAISSNRNNDLLLSLFSFLREPGAGVLLDYGVYYLTALVSVLGPVARVAGVVTAPYKTHRNILPGADFGKLMDTPNESQVSAILRLRNGITGTVHMDNDTNMSDESFFAIYGTKGILHLSNPNDFGGEVRFCPNRHDPNHPDKSVILRQFTPYDYDARGIGPAEMAEAIAQHRPNRASKEMAAHVLEVLEGILAGGEQGKFVDIQSTFDLPAPLEQAIVPISNIGHITFQMKHEAEMLRFYSEILGMRPLFTLTASDLADTIRAQGGQVEEPLKSIVQRDPQAPWIQYMKLSDRQYLELFHGLGGQYADAENREEFYGYQKVNYETADLEGLRQRLADAGIPLKEDIHTTADGSREFAVLDPDGNEIQFTQYTEDTVIPRSEEPPREAVSPLSHTTQVAYQVHDDVNMLSFYTRGLGMRKVYTLTFGDLAAWLEKTGCADAQTLVTLRSLASEPWIDYLEAAPHQYLEFFHTPGPKKQRNPEGHYGYQHLCLEVTDIRKAWDAVTRNGVRPFTQITLGCEGAYQFWMEDPDGNKIEMMEYTPEAKQLLP
ncbi:MAG: VOC family protein [Faecousia sp.]